MPKARGVELLAIVSDDRVREAKPANDVLPYEMLDFSSGDCCQGFDFNPLCEAVHGNDCEFELSFALRHGVDEVQSPLRERPRVDHWGEWFGRQLRN